jgi:hypothetical protein
MQAESKPARAGWQWLQSGFAVYRRNPLMLNALWSIAGGAPLLLVMVLNLVGVLVSLLAFPMLITGVLEGYRRAARGEPVGLDVLLYGFKHPARKSLLKLGLVYTGLLLVALTLSVLPAHEMLSQLLTDLQSGQPMDPAEFKHARLVMYAIAQAAWVLPAPALVAAWLCTRFGLTPAKALFFAVVGIKRNLPAILVFYVVWQGLAMSLALWLPALAEGLGDHAAAVVSFLLAVVNLFVLTPTVVAALTGALEDIFHANHGEHLS